VVRFSLNVNFSELALEVDGVDKLVFGRFENSSCLLSRFEKRTIIGGCTEVSLDLTAEFWL